MLVDRPAPRPAPSRGARPRRPPPDQPERLEAAQLLWEVLWLALDVVERAVADQELLCGLGNLRVI